MEIYICCAAVVAVTSLGQGRLGIGAQRSNAGRLILKILSRRAPGVPFVPYAEEGALPPPASTSGGTRCPPRACIFHLARSRNGMEVVQ